MGLVLKVFCTKVVELLEDQQFEQQQWVNGFSTRIAFALCWLQLLQATDEDLPKDHPIEVTQMVFTLL